MSALETIVLTQNNIKAVCRTCLEKKSHLFSFKDSVAIEGEKFNPTVIGDMLQKVTLGQIRLEKGLPKKICTKCVSLLQAAYVFHLKMQESTNILKFFMITTSGGKYQIPQNETNSTKPVVKDLIKPSTSSEKVIKVTELSQNVLTQIQVEPLGENELQLKQVQNPTILPKNDLRKTEPVMEKNAVGNTNNAEPIQLLFPTNVSFKIEPLVENQMLNKEVKIFNVVPQKRLGNARPTVEVKQQEIVAVNQPVGTENNIQTLQVLSKDALNEKVTKKNIAPKNIALKRIAPKTIVPRKIAPKNVSNSAQPMLQTLGVGDGIQTQNRAGQTISNRTETVDQKVGDAPVGKPEKEKCNIPENGVKVADRSVAPLYACPICEEELSTPNELKQHAHNHKGLKKYLNLPSLEENLKFRAKPRDTVSLFNRPQILHKCPHCTKEISGQNISNHFNNHLKQGRFKCDQCGRIFRRINNLNMHRIQHLKELPYWCIVCEKGFVIKKNYDCHLLTHTVSVTQFPHECPYCFKRFANPQHLHRHKVIHTDKLMYHKKYRVIRCGKCYECFKTEVQLANHTCIPTEITLSTRFPCKLCKKVFQRPGGLYAHINYIHKQKNRQFELCHICGNLVKCISIHMQIHTMREKTHQCVLCGMKFVSLSRLKQHIKVHTGEMKYNCSQCEKRFPTKQRLNRHFMRIHSNLRPYVCKVCAKTFNDPNNLRVHERIHMGIKNHICRICDKGFIEKAYLKRHYINVHKVVSVT